MKRRRPSAPGRRSPDGRWFHPILLAVILVALAACGQTRVSDLPSAGDSAGPTAPSATGSTSELPSEATGASAEPSGSQAQESSAARPSVDPGSAAVCSGSDANRDFFASMAAAVDWTVYCPVLPDGWFVDDGQYRLAGGGWMEIGYAGPGDARILLREGAFCGDSGGGCAPTGRDAGDAAFGDRTGALLEGGDGAWSVVVARGATPSWLLTISGLDEAAARGIAAALVSVAR